jgi:tetratricopeptide (TPR) repeat protein
LLRLIVLLRLLLILVPFLLAQSAQSATVLVVRFHNTSPYPDLDWVGESVAETLRSEFNQSDQIVPDRNAGAEGMNRLALRPDAVFTKATLIHLGRTLDADHVVYGTYEVKLSPNSSRLQDSSVSVTMRFIDLRKLKDGPDITETGKLTDLARLEEHLAWESLKYLEPGVDLSLDKFLAPQKLTRLDAEESYIRGLLSSSKEQQQKWFLQAANLDPHFVGPAYELGKLYAQRKEYRLAVKWLLRVPVNDIRYPDARFQMGLSAYGAADYNAAGNYFRDVAKIMPLNEVYNNLAASEDQLNQPVALDDYRRALTGDPNDPVYQFNLGAALLRSNSFDEAAKQLQNASSRLPEDTEISRLLGQANARLPFPPNTKPLAAARLKPNLDATAFRQLKAVLQPKNGQ